MWFSSIFDIGGTNMKKLVKIQGRWPNSQISILYLLKNSFPSRRIAATSLRPTSRYTAMMPSGVWYFFAAA
jgi:hypothetical protein